MKQVNYDPVELRSPYQVRREKVRNLRAIMSLATKSNTLRETARAIGWFYGTADAQQQLYDLADRIDAAFDNIEVPEIKL